jgi:AAA+ ATPase superfamily predicted ATPase
MNTLINRESYIKEFDDMRKNSRAQLLALYGRRRVGKTCLVRHCFQQSNIRYMEVTGLQKGSMRQQLGIFTKSLSNCFFSGAPISASHNWFDAFNLLNTQLISTAAQPELRVIFFDELPWLTTKRSGLLSALDHYWNTQWSQMQNLIVILCGSAASWMLDKVINAKGGLHNRLTKMINLRPFTLAETKQFLLSKKMRVSDKNILDLYMVMGGIPYYLEQLQSQKSVAENIHQLCFTTDGLLRTEFPRLFRSLFALSEINLRIIKAIAQNRSGLSRQQIIHKTKIASGSNLNNRLNELMESGFINRYAPYKGNKKEMYYRLIDEYTLFYLRWIEPNLNRGHDFSNNHWQIEMKTPAWQSWAGYTFESICMKHSSQIQKALNLQNIGCQVNSWRHVVTKKSAHNGAQIDLLFDRNDDAITLCEIKYSEKPFVLDKATAKLLLQKKDVFIQQTMTKKQIFIAMVTVNGLKPGLWDDEVVDAVVELSALFVV